MNNYYCVSSSTVACWNRLLAYSVCVCEFKHNSSDELTPSYKVHKTPIYASRFPSPSPVFSRHTRAQVAAYQFAFMTLGLCNIHSFDRSDGQSVIHSFIHSDLLLASQQQHERTACKIVMCVQKFKLNRLERIFPLARPPLSLVWV